MTVGALDVLKVKPFNVHLGVVVVLAQVHSANAGNVDLVQDRIVGLDRKLFVAVLNGQLNAGLQGELFVVLWRHHVLGADAKAPVGQTVQRAKEREVGVGVQIGELLDSPVARFGGSLLGKSKVADLHRVHIIGQLLLNDAQKERRLARAGWAENFGDVHSSSSTQSSHMSSVQTTMAVCGPM